MKSSNDGKIRAMQSVCWLIQRDIESQDTWIQRLAVNKQLSTTRCMNRTNRIVRALALGGWAVLCSFKQIGET